MAIKSLSTSSEWHTDSSVRHSPPVPQISELQFRAATPSNSLEFDDKRAKCLAHLSYSSKKHRSIDQSLPTKEGPCRVFLFCKGVNQGNTCSFVVRAFASFETADVLDSESYCGHEVIILSNRT